jgi:hypothetical protein
MLIVWKTPTEGPTATIPPILTSLDGETRSPLATILADSWTAEDRAAFGIYLVERAKPPPGHVIMSSSFDMVDGLPVHVIETQLFVPPSVTPRQMRLALLAYGLLDTVEAFVAQQTRDVQISWDAATMYYRADPMVVGMGHLLGLTPEDLDNLFIMAHGIE